MKFSPKIQYASDLHLEFPSKAEFQMENPSLPVGKILVLEQFVWIENSGISFWTFGHHYSNTPAFNIGKTTLVSSQQGYVQRNDNLQLNTNK
ncbi:MAG: hypothetical protein JJU02_04205 [Cryomorphaceae bacterium]|nr:hypothetical protein [Cryomorphaceae bacterium]